MGNTSMARGREVPEAERSAVPTKVTGEGQLSQLPHSKKRYMRCTRRKVATGNILWNSGLLSSSLPSKPCSASAILLSRTNDLWLALLISFSTSRIVLPFATLPPEAARSSTSTQVAGNAAQRRLAIQRASSHPHSVSGADRPSCRRKHCIAAAGLGPIIAPAIRYIRVLTVAPPSPNPLPRAPILPRKSNISFHPHFAMRPAQCPLALCFSPAGSHGPTHEVLSFLVPSLTPKLPPVC